MKGKRLLAILLSVILTAGSIPGAASAAETVAEPEAGVEQFLEEVESSAEEAAAAEEADDAQENAAEVTEEEWDESKENSVQDAAKAEGDGSQSVEEEKAEDIENAETASDEAGAEDASSSEEPVETIVEESSNSEAISEEASIGGTNSAEAALDSGEAVERGSDEAATLTGVQLDCDKVTIQIGGTVQLNASAVPGNADAGSLIWEVDDDSIATVDGSGLVTGVGIGTTTVYVYSEGYQYFDTCELKVTKINLSSASVLRVSGSRPYTGDKIQPVPVVKLGGVTLQEGRDYKVNYSRNTNVGTATIIITGQNNYSGSTKRTFEIVKANNKIIKLAWGSITLPVSIINYWGASYLTMYSQDKFNAKKTYKLLSVTEQAKKYIALSSGGKLTIKKGIKTGTYKIKVRVDAAEGKNYKKASATKTITVLIKNHMKQYSSLSALGVKGYSKDVDRKVNAAFDEMIVGLNGDGVKYASLSEYQKAYAITLYIGSTYYYKDGSYNAESMLDKGYGTCFAYSDLTYLMAKKAGLKNTWLTVAGRNVDHNGKFYGSRHRSVVTKIVNEYYELDSNMVANCLIYGSLGDFTPERISESYAKYLIGQAKTYKTIK